MEAAGAAEDAETLQLWAALHESGLTGKKLACFERTDAGDIAAQLCMAVGLVYQTKFGRRMESWIAAAKSEEPWRKRLKGEHTMDPLHLQDWQLRRAVDGLPAISGLARPAEDAEWLPRPLRARPLVGEQAKARQEAEDEAKEKWAVELANDVRRIRALALAELELRVDSSRLPSALDESFDAAEVRQDLEKIGWPGWRVQMRVPVSQVR